MNKWVKRSFSTVLSAAMVITMTACGSTQTAKESSSSQAAVETNAVSTADSAASSSAAAKSDVTLKFQQWWGVELPDVCANLNIGQMVH